MYSVIPSAPFFQMQVKRATQRKMTIYKTLYLLLLLFSIFTQYSCPEVRERVLLGNNADIKNFPYAVMLATFGVDVYCGGTIIHPQWILTAAHCLDSEIPHAITIIAGTSYVNGTNGDLYGVENITYHRDFNTTLEAYDIGLIKVSGRIQFNDRVQSVKLPSQDFHIPVGANATVVGWGMTKEFDDNSLPQELQSATVPVWSNTHCNATYNGSSIIMDHMLCAGYEEGGADVCKGDSGSPLTYKGYLIGIVSHGQFCGRAASPGVYMRVTYFLDWIRNHTGIDIENS